jgi:hypothetical protein
MKLLYDDRDDEAHRARGSEILYWLDDLGAIPISEARPGNEGYLFAGARPIDDYRRLVSGFPALRDTPEARSPLLRLDAVLDALAAADANVPTPRTWRLPLDAKLPDDLMFPLFLRTPFSSLKLGGNISRVRNAGQLETEAMELRRLLGWDALILAREWCDLAQAGSSVYGPVPQEIRTWIVDQEPFAWSFHYLNVVQSPSGFPPSEKDLYELKEMARRVGAAFSSRCVVADFARSKKGQWLFIEAGPGSCAGTAHEHVFKSVAARLLGELLPIPANAVGGLFGE